MEIWRELSVRVPISGDFRPLMSLTNNNLKRRAFIILGTFFLVLMPCTSQESIA